VANGIQYFPDCSKSTILRRSAATALNSTSGSFSNKAITDANGKLLPVNQRRDRRHPRFGRIEGYPRFQAGYEPSQACALEGKELQIQVNAINFLNHPVFANPNVSINSTNSGRITVTSTGTTPRQFVTTLRFNLLNRQGN
jgi:hypothetical protein